MGQEKCTWFYKLSKEDLDNGVITEREKATMQILDDNLKIVMFAYQNMLREIEGKGIPMEKLPESSPIIVQLKNNKESVDRLLEERNRYMKILGERLAMSRPRYIVKKTEDTDAEGQ